jgi:hypothetical protein
MTAYNDFFWFSSSDQLSKYLGTARINSGSHMRVTRWCDQHGAKTVEDKFDEHTKFVLSGRYIDFYDEEMYTMFKLRWA